MADFTPGPWACPLGEFDCGNDGSRRIMRGTSDDPDYSRIGTVDSRIERISRGKNATPYNAPDAERDANGRLMAAAPELYEALRAVLAELQQLSCGCTAKEFLSGHRTDCRMPWVREAEEKARVVLEKVLA